jgi:hypothetical protein
MNLWKEPEYKPKKLPLVNTGVFLADTNINTHFGSMNVMEFVAFHNDLARTCSNVLKDNALGKELSRENVKLLAKLIKWEIE